MNGMRTGRATLLFVLSISLLMMPALIGCQSGASQPTTALTAATSVPATLPSSATSVASSTTITAEQSWLGTTSTATLPASGPSFHRELSGAGYYTSWVHTVPEGDTKVMEVWVWVDPAKAIQPTYDAIYEHTIALAKK